MRVRLIEYAEWKGKNRPGCLARHQREFAARGVDLQGLWCGPFGVAASARKPVKLRAALRAMKVRFKIGKCFITTGKDKRGAMQGLLEKLAAAKINIEGGEALAAGGKFSFTFCVKKKDLAKAKRLLRA